ncbi:MAG: PA2169 family four-helix-bundle protein [Flavobacterium sp.]
MKKNKTIETLNDLIVIFNDRVEGYTLAESETEEFDLKALFSHFITTSHKCKQELEQEVTTMGGTVATGTSLSGVFFRVWKYIKKNLFGKDRRTILISCEFGESLVANAYTKILKNDSRSLNEKQLEMIQRQKSLLQTDQYYLKSFSEVFLQA